MGCTTVHATNINSIGVIAPRETHRAADGMMIRVLVLHEPGATVVFGSALRMPWIEDAVSRVAAASDLSGRGGLDRLAC